MNKPIIKIKSVAPCSNIKTKEQGLMITYLTPSYMHYKRVARNAVKRLRNAHDLFIETQRKHLTPGISKCCVPPWVLRQTKM
jgi:hypothetical protein